MAIERILKFIKDPTGVVLLYNTQSGALVASFSADQSVIKEQGDLYRFRIVSNLTSNEQGFLLDFRTISPEFCYPILSTENYDQFLMELGRKFFSMQQFSSKHTPYIEGELLIFKRAGNLNPLELEVNDFVMGMIEEQFIQGTCLVVECGMPKLINFDIQNRTEF